MVRPSQLVLMMPHVVSLTSELIKSYQCTLMITLFVELLQLLFQDRVDYFWQDMMTLTAMSGIL